MAPPISGAAFFRLQASPNAGTGTPQRGTPAVGAPANAVAIVAASTAAPGTAPGVATARAEPSPRPRHPARDPRALRLLGRLRNALGQIAPVPATAVQAHRAIADAMCNALLGGWSLPAFDAPTNRLHLDGTISIPLISHVVVINPWGGFCIVDCLDQANVWFEMPGDGRRAFAMPRDVAGLQGPMRMQRLGCRERGVATASDSHR